MKSPFYLFIAFIAFCAFPAAAQRLQPGFDKAESAEMLKIAQRTARDTVFWSSMGEVEKPQHSTLVYRSAVMGLENRWDLWMKDTAVAVISIRGTTKEAVSWLVNFYSAMTAAKGTLRLSANTTFDYNLASNPKAAVHTGFLTAMCFLAGDIVTHIDSCYRQGIRNFIITGHSQGGAICYLLTSYLYSLQAQGRLPADIQFKTYCGAAPKPGNLYYAYDYEAMTQGGWAYNVVNSADWVPEAGLSIQTMRDFNTTNPFTNAKSAIKAMKFPANLAAGYIYGRLNNITLRAQRRYQNNLGNLMSKFIKKNLPGFQPPAYSATMNYVRTGATIVLLADSDYYTHFPDSDKNIFIHHFPEPYLYLLDKLKVAPPAMVR